MYHKLDRLKTSTTLYQSQNQVVSLRGCKRAIKMLDKSYINNNAASGKKLRQCFKNKFDLTLFD